MFWSTEITEPTESVLRLLRLLSQCWDFVCGESNNSAEFSETAELVLCLCWATLAITETADSLLNTQWTSTESVLNLNWIYWASIKLLLSLYGDLWAPIKYMPNLYWVNWAYNQQLLSFNWVSRWCLNDCKNILPSFIQITRLRSEESVYSKTAPQRTPTLLLS